MASTASTGSEPRKSIVPRYPSTEMSAKPNVPRVSVLCSDFYQCCWRCRCRLPGFNFTGDEDCLFLSVYAPAIATSLPGTYSPRDKSRMSEVWWGHRVLWLTLVFINSFAEAMLTFNHYVSAGFYSRRRLRWTARKHRFDSHHHR